MATFRALGHHVIVKPLEKPTQTSSGLFLPPTKGTHYKTRGTVIAVGPGRVSEKDGRRIPIEIEVGVTVQYSQYAGKDFVHEEELYTVLPENAVLLID